jgi:DNA-binding NtrC family response regulator
MSTNSISVLLVDDDQLTREMLSTLLKSEGFQQPTFAGSYEAALNELKKGVFSILILDYHLDEQDGVHLLEMMRGNGDETPVLLLSGTLTEESVLRASRHKRVDFLAKPFELIGLIKAIQKLIAS